jgi:hypothetical protein
LGVDLVRHPGGRRTLCETVCEIARNYIRQQSLSQ